MGDGIGDFAFWLAVGLSSLGLFFGPVGRAIGLWIESHSKARPQELTPELEQRLAELEMMGQRLLEVEDRLDFAERLLTSGSRPEREADTPPEPVDAAP